MTWVNNQFLLSDLNTPYFLSLLFPFILIIVNSDGNLNSGLDLKKNCSIAASCASIWRSKCIRYLVDTDCVELITTGCHLCEFKVLGHSIHSQVFSVSVFRKETPKVVQGGRYLGNYFQKSSGNS